MTRVYRKDARVRASEQELGQNRGRDVCAQTAAAPGLLVCCRLVARVCEASRSSAPSCAVAQVIPLPSSAPSLDFPSGIHSALYRAQVELCAYHGNSALRWCRTGEKRAGLGRRRRARSVRFTPVAYAPSPSCLQPNVYEIPYRKFSPTRLYSSLHICCGLLLVFLLGICGSSVLQIL